MSTISQSRNSRFPTAIALWIALCALLNCAGWILSALHALNRTGYFCVFVAAVAGAALFYEKGMFARFSAQCALRKFRQRFKRKFPLAFLILAVMAIAGGVIYAPANYDALAYRMPRVLHWLAEGRWHWIHTDFARLNTRATGFEWIATPVILFTGTDRFLFLIDAVSFLLLPGLVFSVFTRLGVRPRVAWHWMWIVPTGYCFLLQAGGIANDMFGAVFVLAALDLALRARESRQAGEVWLSIIAAGLCTGGKASNIPLLLPWCIAILPAALPRIKAAPLAAIFIAIVATLSSAVPNSLLNIKYCGDWTGSVAEGAKFKGKPFTCIAGNALLLPFQNLVPPVFPLSNLWNKHADNFLPRPVIEKLHDCFEQGGAFFTTGEMQIEEEAGLGFGVTVLLLVTVAASLLMPSQGNASRGEFFAGNWWRTLILFSPYVSLLVFMAKSGLSGGGRLITPYYALLMPLLLIRSQHSQLTRKKWWRRVAVFLVFILSALLLVIEPTRPLWPANSILSRFAAKNNAPLIVRSRSVYASYQNREKAFQPMLEILPPDTGLLGIVSFDDLETSLWKPFGHRVIRHVTRSDSLEDLQRAHIKYVLATSEWVSGYFGVSFDDWLRDHHGVILKEIPLTLRTSQGPRDWFLVEIQP